MIVAFLDLLGFSSLLKENEETALDNLNAVNDAIRTRITDRRVVCSPSTSDSGGDSNAEKWALTSFNQMISFSDSLVLGGDDANAFVSHLANFVAYMYIKRSEPFRKPIYNINNITTNQNVDVLGHGFFRCHQAAPIFFRGGVSVGDQIRFFDGHNIKDSEVSQSRNVTGNTYLNAVKLEKSGKGPRLFCDHSVVDALSDKSVKDMIKRVKGETEIFEIVWTMEGCSEGCSIQGNRVEEWKNVCESINTTMLPPAINLYRYYQGDGDLKEQYEELLKLVCCGIVKYADIKCNRANDAIDLINQKLQNIWTIDIWILNNFLN
ncbi:MAG: hypothetical protein NC094_04755 [Bacteroidales bacterium]|nr:hypothetical protein [Lachnoclostridium sp.]MCM1384001.1 hypothetical protein [Lachnoclostridium sp.]MCM1464709.1 hypothetical protein [Bacteroidales bacterium]